MSSVRNNLRQFQLEARRERKFAKYGITVDPKTHGVIRDRGRNHPIRVLGAPGSRRSALKLAHQICRNLERFGTEHDPSTRARREMRDAGGTGETLNRMRVYEPSEIAKQLHEDLVNRYGEEDGESLLHQLDINKPLIT